MTHPNWCAHRHGSAMEHRSHPLVVALPAGESFGAQLVGDDSHPGEPWAELVQFDAGQPVPSPLDPHTIGWLVVPATHLTQMAAALTELATLATGGTR